MQSPASDGSHIRDIGIGELLVANIIRVHGSAKVLVGAQVQFWAAGHEIDIRHRTEAHQVAHIVKQMGVRL